MIHKLISTVLLGYCLTAQADPFDRYYRQALANDPIFAAAKAQYEADLRHRPIGRASLLPSVSLSSAVGSTRYNRVDQTTRNPLDANYRPENVTLRLSQPVFDLERWAAWKEGDARSRLAEVSFVQARQEVALRFARAWYDYLLARDTHRLATAQRESLAAQMEDAKHLYKGGFSALTDVEETKARLNIAIAAETAAGNLLDLRRREVERLVGSEINEHEIPSADKIALAPPQPNDPQHWVAAAKRQNPKVLGQELAREIAGHQVDRAKAAHWPSAALVASTQRAKTPNYFTHQEDVNSVMLQVEFPLFSGGGTTARGEQNEFLRLRAEYQLEDARREAEIKANQYYLEILNGIARIQAMEVAEASSEISLNGMIAGQKVGFRTNTDILNARQQLFNVRRDLQKERYAFLLNQLELAAVVATLGD